MANYTEQDVKILTDAALGKTQLSQDQMIRYNLTGTPTVVDVNRIQKHVLAGTDQSTTPADKPGWEPSAPPDFGQPPGSTLTEQDIKSFMDKYGGSNIPMPQFAPPMSLSEQMAEIDRRVQLLTGGPLQALQHQLEMDQLSGERRKGEVKEAYGEAYEELQAEGKLGKQSAAEMMARRGIYDSGMAADVANRISLQTQKLGVKLKTEEARVLADIAEYLDLRQRHTTDEIKRIMGEAGVMAESMLHEMRMEERNRQDRIATVTFEAHLARQAADVNAWQAISSYGIQQDKLAHDAWATGANLAYNVWATENQMEQRKWETQIASLQWDEQMAFNEASQAFKEYTWRKDYDQAQFWGAIDLMKWMNDTEWSRYIQTLKMNNEISQQTFNNLIDVLQFDFQVKAFEHGTLY